MAKNARSIKLNKAIEDELKIMLTLGFDKAPISATKLHERLLAKGVIKGKLSTLSSRAGMIAEYRYQQMSSNEIKEEKHVYGSKAYYKERNQKLIAEVSELNTKLNKNTTALIEIIRRVESQTPVKVEDLVRHILNPIDDVPY
tara:strand:+ start:5690 stop:6118 length:429 start_codon:yes stop_codon:yes gene_type:complete